MKNPLIQLVRAQKAGKNIGIYSACSANPFVIEAVLKKGLEDNSCVLIESTANQCDQFGGYTGMKPLDFKNYVYDVANKIGFNKNKLFLGGDHLGPLTWTSLNEKDAMMNSETLIEAYVSAGFTKIHIDTSMKVLDDDKKVKLSDEVIAKRGVYLVKVAEKAYKKLLEKNPNAIEPIYIVGSEVPIPGGSQSATDEGIQVTNADDFIATMNTFKECFKNEGIIDVWDRVIGIVVQPGVEEKDSGCTEYNREKAKDLSNTIKKIPNLIFEGHSTDYQTKIKLREMVEDGVAILKVGPGLTYAAREGLYALSFIEDEICKITKRKPSNFREVLDQEMIKNTKFWIKHYHGTDQEIALKRKYSFSDRSRYYYSTEPVKQSIITLLDNLNDGCPLNLLSQFMPLQYTKVREGKLNNNPRDLLLDKIGNTIDDYLYATHQKELF